MEQAEDVLHMGVEGVVRVGAGAENGSELGEEENGSELGEAEMAEVEEKHTQVLVGANNELVVAVATVMVVNILHMVVEVEVVLCMVVEEVEVVLCMEPVMGVAENGQGAVENGQGAVAVMRMDKWAEAVNVEAGAASGEVVEVNDVAAGVVNYSNKLVGVENTREVGENLAVAVAVVRDGRSKLEAAAMILVVAVREGEEKVEAAMEMVVGARVEEEKEVVVKAEGEGEKEVVVKAEGEGEKEVVVKAENKQVVEAVAEGAVEVSKLVGVEVEEAKETAEAVMVEVGK